MNTEELSVKQKANPTSIAVLQSAPPAMSREIPLAPAMLHQWASSLA